MNSLMLGIIEDFLNDHFVRIVLDVLSFIPKIMYFIIACLTSVIDMFQVLFRKLAGLDPVILNGDVTTGDTTYKLITDILFTGKYPAINTIFWSLIILAVIMLIVTSIIATIRLEYNPDKEKGNSKSKIVGGFFKGLFSLLIIPVASIFGMFLCNTLVGAINTITNNSLVTQHEIYQYFDEWGNEDVSDEFKDSTKSSYIAYNVFGLNIPTTAEPFSGMVFKASAYSCNRFRLHGANYLNQVNNSKTDLGIFDGSINESSVAADIIDTAFSINAKVKSGANNDLDSTGIEEKYYRSIFGIFGHTDNLDSFSKYNVEMVWFFYDLWSFNYIVSFIALLVIGKIYYQFCLMLISRIFEIIGLFFIAPIPISIMPLDGGASLGRWRTTYIGKYALILVTVFGLNVITPFITVLHQIKFFGFAVIDYIVIAALSAVSSLINAFSVILFDKSSAYSDSLKNAEGTASNFQTGLGKTKDALTFASAPVSFAAAGLAKGAIWGGKKGIDAYGNHRETKFENNLAKKRNEYIGSEKEAIKQGLEYDEDKVQNTYHNMHSDARGNMADDFIETAAGNEWVNKYFNGDKSKARDAIAYDGMSATGVHKKKSLEGSSLSDQEKKEAREALKHFMFDRDNFDKTKSAMEREKGSAGYIKALDEYRAMSDDEKLSSHVGGVALNDTQRNIQKQIAAYEIEEKEKRDKRKKRNENIKNSIGKGLAFTNKRVKRYSDSLQNVTNTIPGLELFKKKDK